MPQLDSLMMAMRTVPQEKIMALALTESERVAQQMMEGGGQAPDPNLSAEAEKFSADLTAHTEAIQSIYGKLNIGALPGPPPGGKEQRDCEPASCAVSS